MSDIDEKEEYESKRELRGKVMSEKEIKEADKYLRWYRNSFNSKQQQGLYKKWEEVDKYWEGDLEEPEDDSDPCCNTNIVNSNVEGKVALLTEQNLAIQVDPIEPSDIHFCDRVRIMGDFIKDRNKMFRKIDLHERRREKFGTGIWRVLWKTDELDGLGIPEIDTLHPGYVFPDSAITDIYKIQEGRYIIETTNKTIYQARLKYGDEKADAIIPNYEPINETFNFNSDGDNDSESYLHMYVWTKYKEGNKLKLRLIEMSGDGIILSDSKEKEKELKESDKEAKDLFPNDLFPYFFTPDMYREGTIWGKGSAELVLPVSDQIDELDDQIMRNARLSGNPQREVSNQTGVDIEKITNEPGLIIPTNQTNGVKWIEPPSLPAYIITKRNDLMTNDRFIVSRFSDQMVGKNQSGVTTASQALALQQAGNTGIEHKKGMLQETLSDVFEYAIELGLLNWNTTMLFRITSENGERDFDSFNPDSLNNIPLLIESDGEYRKKFKEKNPEAKPEDYAYMQVKDETRKVKYDLKVTVGAGMPNNKAFRYQLMLESKEKQIISKKECRKYLRENLGLNVPAVPESMQEQQEIGIYDDSQILASNEMNQGIMPASVGTSNLAQNSSDIAGLNANNNVSLNSVKKGVM